MPRAVHEPWILAPALPPELGREWARSWEHWFGPARVPLPRAPAKRELALVETPLGRVVAKREHARGWKRPLAALGARGLRSARAFQGACALLERGLATPAPLAVLLRPPYAVLVTRYVEGVGPWEFLERGGTGERLVATLAANLARLHAAGFRHRDLKASNLLLSGPDESPALSWTDLDGLRRLGAVERGTRARDLARLGMSFESAAARAAGVRAERWPELLRAYLEHALGRAPAADELGFYLQRTRVWRERAIRRHLVRGDEVR